MAEVVENKGNTEKKRWKCRYCDKDFSSAQNRWRHEQKFHKDEITKNKEKEDEEDEKVIAEINERIDDEDIDGIELFDDEDDDEGDGFDIVDEDEDKEYIYECPECGHIDAEPFDECPECGEELEWD